jgi:hypothetical protein
MKWPRSLALSLALLPLVSCAGVSDAPVLAPLGLIEPGAGPEDATDPAAADRAAGQIKSAVITGTLLVGGEAAARMLAPADVMPAAGPAGAETTAESPTAAEVRQTAALERMADQPGQRRQAQLVEQWLSTRFEPAQLTREDIRRGQQLLAELGFDPGPIDGFMGPRTRAAIEAFQDAQSIEVTGEMSRSLIDLLAIQGG